MCEKCVFAWMEKGFCVRIKSVTVVSQRLPREASSHTFVQTRTELHSRPPIQLSQMLSVWLCRRVGERGRAWKWALLRDAGLMGWKKLTARSALCLTSGSVFSPLASDSCLGYYHISGAGSNMTNVFQFWAVGLGRPGLGVRPSHRWTHCEVDVVTCHVSWFCSIRWPFAAVCLISPPWWLQTLISKTALPTQDEGIFGLFGHVRPKLYYGSHRSHSAFLLSRRYFLFIIWA